MVGYEVNYGRDFIELVFIDDNDDAEHYTFTPEQMQKFNDAITVVLMEQGL